MFGRQVTTTATLLLSILPGVERELDRWQAKAKEIPDGELARQALASIASKRFHCQGGSVYAACPTTYRAQLIKAIVALQTISDYLDNLCDRVGIQDEEAFLNLHASMTDALRPAATTARVAGLEPEICCGRAVGLFSRGSIYYRNYPRSEDGGYLESLVATCRDSVVQLPAYPAVAHQSQRLIELYSKMQAKKHLQSECRKQRLIEWVEESKGNPGLPASGDEVTWWEFAAAAGSTIGVFALFASATDETFGEDGADKLVKAYFPWICGLHILLDYLIDLEEDRQFGDFNFVACYPNASTRDTRLELFVRNAMERACSLPQPAFHQTCVQGLLALYLSDPKVNQVGLQETARRLLSAGGPGTRALWRLCLFLRRVGVI